MFEVGKRSERAFANKTDIGEPLLRQPPDGVWLRGVKWLRYRDLGRLFGLEISKAIISSSCENIIAFPGSVERRYPWLFKGVCLEKALYQIGEGVSSKKSEVRS